MLCYCAVIHKPDAALQDSAKVAALLQLPKDPLSREHVVNVDNIILTVLQKDHKRKVCSLYFSLPVRCQISGDPTKAGEFFHK